MWQKQRKGILKAGNRRVVQVLTGLGIIVLLLAGCGASGTPTAAGNTASNSAPLMGAHMPAQTQQSKSNNGTSSATGTSGPQYLQKSLQVTMEVRDTRQAADEIQQWLSSSDPQATSGGTDYESAGDNQYNVTLTFLVDIDHYTQFEGYLRDYAGKGSNTLISLKESVQDDTNDYIDSQSTLTNLRAEQQRLLSFMNQAQNLNDAISIEQQLTQVEGQIDNIEAHLNALKRQTTFYTVTVVLQPLGSVPPPAKPSPWSVIPIWQGAWSAVVSVWQVLAAVLVWLLAFSVYIVPVGIAAWLVRKRVWRWRRIPRVAPAAPVPAPQPKEGEED
jgi:hypothetical protein